MITDLSPKLQLAIGGTLFTTPLWSFVLDVVAKGFGAIAAVCGAIIGIHGVYRIIRPKR
jgi:uncharacterized membrane protein YuzA (DUF378 family)